jgi:hypothetical protein
MPTIKRRWGICINKFSITEEADYKMVSLFYWVPVHRDPVTGNRQPVTVFCILCNLKLSVDWLNPAPVQNRDTVNLKPATANCILYSV